MPSNQNTRREFLKQLAGVIGIAPWMATLLYSKKAFAQSLDQQDVFVSLGMRNGWYRNAVNLGPESVSLLATPSAYQARLAPLVTPEGNINGMSMLDVSGIGSVAGNIVVASGLDGMSGGHNWYSPLGAFYRNNQESVDQILAKSFYPASSCAPPLGSLYMYNPDVDISSYSVASGRLLPALSDPAVLYSKIKNQANLGATAQATSSLNLAKNEALLAAAGSHSSKDRAVLDSFIGYLSELNAKVSNMCAVSAATLGSAAAFPSVGGENLTLLADIHGDLIRMAIQCGIRIIGVSVNRSAVLGGQAAHTQSHEAGTLLKEDHYRWIMQHYFVNLAQKLKTLNVRKGMIVAANEMGIQDYIHGWFSFAFPCFVWGSNQPWQLGSGGRVINFQDNRKPLAPQGDFSQGALAVQFYTSIMDFYGVPPSQYTLAGQGGFGSKLTHPSFDSNYAAIYPHLANPLPGLRAA